MADNPFFQRLILLTGPEAANALAQARVTVVGIGGVGSWCAEALVRSGIGQLSLIDCDKVDASNVNRQIEATSSTIGCLKTEVLAERLKDINPDCKINCFSELFSMETADQLGISDADYVIDAIDSLSCKLDLIETSLNMGKTLFSSMGMAQKLDPTLIRTADIWKTSGCPLARLVRAGLRKRGIEGHFTAVYSPERGRNLPRTTRTNTNEEEGKNLPRIDTNETNGTNEGEEDVSSLGKRPMGSFVGVTATAGMILASLVVREQLTKNREQCRYG